jgi:hypothetical protein
VDVIHAAAVLLQQLLEVLPAAGLADGAGEQLAGLQVWIVRMLPLWASAAAVLLLSQLVLAWCCCLATLLLRRAGADSLLLLLGGGPARWLLLLLLLLLLRMLPHLLLQLLGRMLRWQASTGVGRRPGTAAAAAVSPSRLRHA